jgi:DNA-binding CsgD family transcriptional regulator
VTRATKAAWAGAVVHSGGEKFLILLAPPQLDLSRLTPTQRAIVAGIVAGHSNAALARRRRTSVHTIANHLAAIFRRLGVGSRAELVARIAITNLVASRAGDRRRVKK